MTKSNMKLIGDPEERTERMKERQHIDEVMAENLPELEDDECSD